MVHLKRQLARNVWTSWVGYAVRILISFLFVPYITSVLGDARYGVWVIVFQTINYFTLVDFGLEKALARFISKHIGQRAFDRINRVLNTTFVLYLAIGSIIILGAWLVSTYLFGYFKIGNPILATEGRTALVIIGVYMGTRFYLLPFAGSLGGFQRFDIANSLHIIEDIIRTLILVWLLAQGYGLAALAMAILGTSLARQVVAIIFVHRLYPEVEFGLRHSDRETARDMFDYSRITFGITLGWLIIYNTDSVLLGLISSAAAAGIYAPAAQVMLILRNFVNVVANPLTTAASQLESQGNMEAVRRLYLKSVRYTSYFSFVAAVGVIQYASPFIDLWLPQDFFGTYEAMRILAMGVAFFIPQIIGNAVLFAIDKHKIILQTVLTEAALKLILSLILIPRYGVVGMAFAAAIPQMLIYATLYPVLIGRALELPSVTIVMTMLRSGFLAMFTTIPTSILLWEIIPPGGGIIFIINVVVVLLVAAVGGWFVITPEDKRRLKVRLFGLGG